MPEPDVKVVRGERKREPVRGRTEHPWSGKEKERIWRRRGVKDQEVEWILDMSTLQGSWAGGNVGWELGSEPDLECFDWEPVTYTCLVARRPEREGEPVAWALLSLYPLSRPRSSDSCPKLKENPDSDFKSLSEQKKPTRRPGQTTSQTSTVECAC